MRSSFSVAVLNAPASADSVLHRALAGAGCVEAEREADGVVVACDLPAPTLVADLDLGSWTETVEEPLGRALEALIDARDRVRVAGGSVVVVVPNIGIAGAAQLVGLTTLVEGVRAMAKSAARQWAGDGVVVNVLALPLAVLEPSLEPWSSHLAAPAGDAPSIEEIGASLVHLLRAPPSMVGATVMLDGGSVMAP